MKKIFLAIAVLFALHAVNAQVKKIPGKLTSLKREIASRNTGQRGYSKVSIKIDITQTEGKGETMNFVSNTAIEKVELSFAGVYNSKQITTYNADTKDGHFYLESGAYKGGLEKGYLVYFYVKGFDKPVWVCVLSAKK